MSGDSNHDEHTPSSRPDTDSIIRQVCEIESFATKQISGLSKIVTFLMARANLTPRDETALRALLETELQGDIFVFRDK